MLLKKKDMSQKSLSNDGNQTDTQEELDILRYIPEDVLSEMNEEAIYIGRNAQRRTSQKREGEAEAEIDIPPEREAFASEEIDFEVALVASIASSTDATSSRSKWKEISLDEFKKCFANAEAIRSSLIVTEMKTVLILTQNKNEFSKMLKPSLVNFICRLYGDGSKLPQPISSPKSLKAIVVNHILKWPIQTVNVAYI